MTIVHISVPRWSMVKMPVIKCWHCRQRRRVLAKYQDYYGWDCTCLTCGAEWADGERRPLSRSANSRQKVVDKAKATWAKYQTPEGLAYVKANYEASTNKEE